MLPGRDTLSSTLRFIVPQKLCQRFVDLITWLGKLVEGPRSGSQTGFQMEGVLEHGVLFGEDKSQQTPSDQFKRDEMFG